MTLIRRDDIETKLIEPGLYGLKLIDGAHGTQAVSLVRGWLEPGARHSMHSHDVEEVVVFISGCGLVRIDGRDHTIGAGDVVHIRPGVQHETLNTGAENLSFVAAFADNLIASNPLQTTARTARRGPGIGMLLRHRIAWLLRALAHLLTSHP